MQNIIQEIWEIRKMIDEALDCKDLALFTRATERFYNIFKQEKHQQTFATATVGATYENVEALTRDREANFAKIAFSLAKLKKELKGEEQAQTYFQFSSILEVVWHTKELYDLLFKTLKNNSQNKENIETLYSAVEYNLHACYDYYDQLIGGTTTESEQKTLHKIYEEFINKYYEIKNKENSDEHKI